MNSHYGAFCIYKNHMVWKGLKMPDQKTICVELHSN